MSILYISATASIDIYTLSYTTLFRSLRFMPEPFPQRSAWSKLFQPGVNAQRGFRNSTGPKPLDEETLAIFRACLVVNTLDRKSTRLNSSHEWISYAVFCLRKKIKSHY